MKGTSRFQFTFLNLWELVIIFLRKKKNVYLLLISHTPWGQGAQRLAMGPDDQGPETQG